MAEVSMTEAGIEADGKIRYARVYHLWAMGVGAVVSGDFFGWQACLAGGFVGGCISLAIVTVLYLLLSFSTAELASYYPNAGGPYTFASDLLGRPVGFLTGLAESLKVIVTTAVIALGISSYMVEITDTDKKWEPLWWFAFFFFFTALNVCGVKLSFNMELFFTVVSLLVLCVFYCGAIPKFDFHKWVLGICENVNETCPKRWLYNDGVDGVAKGLSFSLWFYLGIEELAMVTEETIDASRTMPYGIIISICTLIAMSSLTLLFSSSIEPGAYAMYNDGSPILTGYETIFNHSSSLDYFKWILVVGLISSFHTFLFCTGRLLYAISRDGLFPSPLSRLHSYFKTPYIALITDATMSYAVIIVLYYVIGNEDDLKSVLINLALLGALISYILQCVSYIVLKAKKLNPDTYHSPFGLPGAVICILLCLLVYACIIKEGVQSMVYLYSVIAAAIYYIVGMTYYVVSSRFSRQKTGEEFLLTSNSNSKYF